MNEMGLALVLSVITALSQGITSFQKNDHKEAVAAFSRVIAQEDVPGMQGKRIALYFRAQSHWQLEEKEAARNDLKTLIKQKPADEWSTRGLELYFEYDGKLQNLMPEKTPEEVVADVQKAIKANELQTALERVTGELKDFLNVLTHFLTMEEGAAEGLITNVLQEIGIVEIRKADPDIWYKRVALIPLAEVSFEVEMVIEEGQWRFARLLDCSYKSGRHHQTANLVHLQQIGLAMRMYFSDVGKYPAELQEVREKGYLAGDRQLLWRDPRNGTTTPFIYCSTAASGVVNHAEFILAAAPKAVNDQREIVYADGRTDTIADADFVKKAVAQNWPLPFLPREEEVSEQLRTRVVALVNDLGSTDYEKRMNAQKELKRIGVKALPILRDFQKHDDPEIRLSVRELLKP